MASRTPLLVRVRDIHETYGNPGCSPLPCQHRVALLNIGHLAQRTACIQTGARYYYHTSKQ